ncbi:uncharacterized protein LOC115918723 isoform X2 [Strongylocentrotus purpuratus]|uniref:Sushi domain-containing protein n=2 Tax=Strongylocentrotus purpuratus TaxID=7668 RepID=A0A7M7NZH1_STRPU|nr:uncharacterized protein LOC115918723 isoform X2 [Strongylocentrotus purpuratus]
MTQVTSCIYRLLRNKSCSFASVSKRYQAFIGCHKPGSIKCGAPYIPHHAMVEDLRLNYNVGDSVNVTCNTSDAFFPLQCHNKGLWSGPLASCPEPKSAPSVDSCTAPAVPIDSTIQNLRLSYKNGDRMNVTCNEGPEWFPVTCEDGTWTGQNIVCPVPAIECNQPIISVDAYIGNVKPRYKNGDQVNITCNDESDSFIWYCQRDGLWRGPTFECSRTHPLPEGQPPSSPGRFTRPNTEHDGRDYFITGLLVTAVILFILVLMCMAVFVIFMRNRGYDLVTSSKDALQDENGSRGPLPDVPEGYANYVAGEQSLYVEPYLKQNGDHIPAYEVYEKPV